MVAGLNISVKIWRFTYPNDDEVGGSQPSGTVLYDSIEARKITRMPTLAFLEQGYETEKVSQFMFWPGTLTIKEKDEFEIISPPNHLDYGKRFRIVGDPDFGFHPGDPKGYLVVTATRSSVAHKNNRQ